MKILNLRVNLVCEVPIVYLDKQIDDELIKDCIATIDELVDKYYYSEIELQISSDGGMVSSMEYFLQEIGEWEHKTKFNTRALTNAASAAAIILSLGSERRAEERSRLLYHSVRRPISSQITVRHAEMLAKEMRPLDEEIADRLATRACEISRDDWKEYLEKCLDNRLKEYRKIRSTLRGLDFNEKTESPSQEWEFDEHAFCARLFNLPVERQAYCHLRRGGKTHSVALPISSSLTGTEKGARSAQVFLPGERWKFIGLGLSSEKGELNHGDIGRSLNAIVEGVIGEMRENSKEIHENPMERLREKIQEYFGTEDEVIEIEDEKFVDIEGNELTSEEWEIYRDNIRDPNHPDYRDPYDPFRIYDVYSYSSDELYVYASPNVSVVLSPEWKIEHLMVMLLKICDEDSSKNSLKKRLCALYHNLFELDAYIPPRVAKALGLIDGIGDQGAFRRIPNIDAPKSEVQSSEHTFRKEIAKSGKALSVYQWRSLYPNGVPWQNLCRHSLILGETGSGKSKSGILPVVKAAVEAAAEATVSGSKPPIGCILVIDPKKEIGTFLDEWAKRQPLDMVKVHKLDENGKKGHSRIRLNLMAHEKLSEDFTESYYIDRANSIFRVVASLIPKHAAGVLLGKSRGGTNDFWDQRGVETASAIVATVLMANDFLGKYELEFLWPDFRTSRLSQLLRKIVEDDAKCGHTNILHSAKLLLGNIKNIEDFDHLAKFVSNIIEYLEKNNWSDVPPTTTLRGIHKALTYAGGAIDTDTRIFASTVASAQNCFFQIAEGVAAKSLFFGVEPCWEKMKKLDFGAAVKIDKENLDIFVYSPDMSRSSELIGRSLKASYFSSVLNDADRVKGLDRKLGNSRPALVGYVADEFHRFITDDMRHGEQSFLDTCRSYGGFCILACQSVESMRHALLDFSDKEGKVNSSIGILLNNTATKLFFRATDNETIKRLGHLFPQGSWGSPVEWRPLSMLSPGECYAVLADGRIERKQLDWVRSIPSEE